MHSNEESRDLFYMKSMVDAGRLAQSAAARNVVRGLLAATTSAAVMMLPALGSSQTEVGIPLADIRVPFYIASIVFLAISFGLALIAVIHHRDASTKSRLVGKHFGELSEIDKKKLEMHIVSLSPSSSHLIFRSPVFAVLLLPIGLHALPCTALTVLALCRTNIVQECAGVPLAIINVLLVMASASPYLYLVCFQLLRIVQRDQWRSELERQDRLRERALQRQSQKARDGND